MQTARFENVSCSQCGVDFGPGEHGFSHCDNHQGMSMQTNDYGHVAGGKPEADTSVQALSWAVDGDGIFSNGKLIMTCWQVVPKRIDDRQEGESWLEMRDRTQAARDAIARETRERAAFVVRACSEYDELKLKAIHYDWLLNEARKTGVTVRFVNGGKDMCVAGGIIEESLVDDLVSALKRMLDAFHEDPFENNTSGAVEQAYEALAKAGAA